jgi:hypothetical protein
MEDVGDQIEEIQQVWKTTHEEINKKLAEKLSSVNEINHTITKEFGLATRKV